MEDPYNETNNIRKAKASDYKQVAPLVVQAMNDLTYKFTQKDDPNQALLLFEYFFQKENNQYSYENTLVYEEDNQIVGSITAYDGALLESLRKPFFQYLKDEYQLADLSVEDETQPGEFYIDTVGVSVYFQRKGIGTKLIDSVIAWAREMGHQRVGLLVDTDNPKAKKLYNRLGFETKSIKPFMGGYYEHMQMQIND